MSYRCDLRAKLTDMLVGSMRDEYMNIIAPELINTAKGVEQSIKNNQFHFVVECGVAGILRVVQEVNAAHHMVEQDPLAR